MGDVVIGGLFSSRASSRDSSVDSDQSLDLDIAGADFRAAFSGSCFLGGDGTYFLRGSGLVRAIVKNVRGRNMKMEYR